jgi:hypothetical protein
MTTIQIGILVLAFIVLALLLAIAINRIHRRWKFRKFVAAVEQPTIKRSEQPESAPSLRDMAILPPHKSAARPSNVKAIARKPKPKESA